MLGIHQTRILRVLQKDRIELLRDAVVDQLAIIPALETQAVGIETECPFASGGRSGGGSQSEHNGRTQELAAIHQARFARPGHFNALPAWDRAYQKHKNAIRIFLCRSQGPARPRHPLVLVAGPLKSGGADPSGSIPADPRLLLHITTCTGVTPPYARHGAFEPGRRSSPALRPTNRIWRRDVVPHQDPPDARRAREPTGRRAIEW